MGPTATKSLESPDTPLTPGDIGGLWSFCVILVCPLESDQSDHLITQTHGDMHIFTYMSSVKVARGGAKIVEQTKTKQDESNITGKKWWKHLVLPISHTSSNSVSYLQVEFSLIYLRLSSVTFCPRGHMLAWTYFLKLKSELHSHQHLPRRICT